MIYILDIIPKKNVVKCWRHNDKNMGASPNTESSIVEFSTIEIISTF